MINNQLTFRNLIKRFFDLIIVIIALLIFSVPMFFLALVVFFSSKGPIFYWSDRIGLMGKTFKMPKFRTMLTDTPAIATHLLENPDAYLSPVGGLLRRSSLDELPQLWSVLKGDMSFVGPRPALFNQKDLIKLRNEHGVDKLLPGITGWAQINGRDELSIPDKVKLDKEYLKNQSFWLDIKILWKTFLKVIQRDDVSH
jgi:O-antigen biosynthesis protein WbqP